MGWQIWPRSTSTWTGCSPWSDRSHRGVIDLVDGFGYDYQFEQCNDRTEDPA
jgi:hypothetical protein